MATKALPSVLAANAAEIVNQAADHVVAQIQTYQQDQKQQQQQQRPFSNRLVRIVNSPDPIRAPLSDAERAAVQAMLQESHQVEQRAQQQSQRQQRLQQRFDQDLRLQQDRDQHDAQVRARVADERRQQDRRRRAEMALQNIARRAQVRQAEKEQLRRARELVRRTSKASLAAAAAATTTEPVRPAVAAVDPRLRWERFVRRQGRTKWRRAEKQVVEEEIGARLLKRYDYGMAIRRQYAPAPSAKLHAQLAERIAQLQHPAYVRQARDVRALHPVVGGRPGTEKPPPPESEQERPPPLKRYPNYLGGMYRNRVGVGHLSKAELEERIRAWDDEIVRREERSSRPRDASPGRLGDDIARLSLLYVKKLSAKTHLCDLYEAEQLFSCE